jgi:hypothetical protein
MHLPLFDDHTILLEIQSYLLLFCRLAGCCIMLMLLLHLLFRSCVLHRIIALININCWWFVLLIVLHWFSFFIGLLLLLLLGLLVFVYAKQLMAIMTELPNCVNFIIFFSNSWRTPKFSCVAWSVKSLFHSVWDLHDWISFTSAQFFLPLVPSVSS